MYVLCTVYSFYKSTIRCSKMNFIALQAVTLAICISDCISVIRAQ